MKVKAKEIIYLSFSLRMHIYLKTNFFLKVSMNDFISLFYIIFMRKEGVGMRMRDFFKTHWAKMSFSLKFANKLPNFVITYS